MEVHFATMNMGKIRTMTRELARYGIKAIHKAIDMPEPRSYDLRVIAKHKVLYAYQKIKKPCIALDAGFFVDSLNGFPRTFVNFALETIGVEGILKLCEGKGRKCGFRDCLAYMDGTLREPMCFESSVDGILADRLKGESREYHWSRLFLVFIPRGSGKTLAEMDPEEYERWHSEILGDESSTGKFANWYKERNAKT